MKPVVRSLLTVVSFAAVTAGVGLPALWPTETLADAFADPNAGLASPDTKVDHVSISGDLVKSDTSKTGWVVRVKLENKGDEVESVALQTEITRTTSNPMARAMPRPTVVQHGEDTITLAAGEKRTVEYEVSPAVAKQLDDHDKAMAQLTASTKQTKTAAPKAKPAPESFMMSRTYFGVRFQRNA